MKNGKQDTCNGKYIIKNGGTYLMRDKIAMFNWSIMDDLRSEIRMNDDTINSLIKLYLLGYLKDDLILKYKQAPVKEQLAFAYTNIGEAYPSLKQALAEISIDNKLKEITLARTVKLIMEVPFTKEEWKNAIEELINLYDNKSSCLTPECINALGIELLSPINGSFYDGSAGLNGTIITAHRYAKERNSELSIFTQELNHGISAIGQIRAFVNGITNIKAVVGDTLLNPGFTEGDSLQQFDYIMMNFPFGVSWQHYDEKKILYDKYSRFEYGKPPKSSSEWLFVSHLIKSLKPHGKGIAIVTGGALFNAVTSTIRKNVVKEDVIEAIIALPSGLYNTTAIPVNMVVFNKNKPVGNKIQFINAEEIFTTVPKTTSRVTKTIGKHDIEKIVSIYRDKFEVEEVSKLVNVEELDNMLLPRKYVAKNEVETDNLGTAKIYPREFNKLPNLRQLGEIASFYRGINTVSCTSKENGEYQIINLSDVQDGKLNLDTVSRYDIETDAKVDNYTVTPGDIIVSNKGSAIKISIIPEHEGQILISQNFIGIRLNQKQSAEFIKEYLLSPLGQYLISSKQLGSTITMLNVKDLQEIHVISLPKEEQEKISSEYEEKKKAIELQISKLEKEAIELQLDLYKQMGIEKVFKLIEE